jgi:hypothetical protein
MPEFKSKEEYEKWKAQSDKGHLIKPVVKDASRIIISALYAFGITFMLSGFFIAWKFMSGYRLFGVFRIGSDTREPYGVLFYFVGVFALVIFIGSFVMFMLRKEVKCPYCDKIIEFGNIFSDAFSDTTGLTCTHCEKRSVIKDNRLHKVT